MRVTLQPAPPAPSSRGFLAVPAALCLLVAAVAFGPSHRVAAAPDPLSHPDAPASDPVNWPQFRGPGGQGVSLAKNLPLNWDEKTNIRWKTPIHGKGWSSPVIWGEQVWLTTATEDGHKLYAVCVDKATGRITFDLQVFDVAAPQFCHPFNSYASPTPAVEEGRVYVTFGSPGTACLDTATGKVLWERRDFVCNHFRGAGSSPLLYGNKLFMHFDGSDYQYVVALDKNTGQTLWRTDRSLDYKDLGPDGKPKGQGDFRKAFSTPRIATFTGPDGKPQKPELISVGSQAFYAYDPDTGKELWRVENRASFSGTATPVIGGDTVYLCTGHGKSELWAIKPGGYTESGVLPESRIAWKLRKNVPTRSSPVLADGLLYMVDDGGIASCTDAQTGQTLWHNRLEGNFSAAPIYAAGRVYFFSESGKTTVVAAGREFKKLAENQLDDGFMADPAVSGEALFLRTKTTLYRVD